MSESEAKIGLEADAAFQVRRGRSLEISAVTNLPTCSATLASAIE
jgi:hypothetical protein